MDNVHRCEHSISKAPEVVRLISARIEDEARAMERIKKGFVHVCAGDPLARLADDLNISEQILPRLKQGSGRLIEVLDSIYMFN